MNDGIETVLLSVPIEGPCALRARDGTVDATWYFLPTRGQMWRRFCERQEVVDAGPGDLLTIPVGQSSTSAVRLRAAVGSPTHTKGVLG